MLVSPDTSDDSLPFLRSFLNDIRQGAEGISPRWPAMKGSLTGQPAITVEEMDTVRSDTWFTAGTVLCFPSRRGQSPRLRFVRM